VAAVASASGHASAPGERPRAAGGRRTEELEAGDIRWEGEGVIKCDAWEKKDCGPTPYMQDPLPRHRKSPSKPAMD
jgi:hypothetical protein